MITRGNAAGMTYFNGPGGVVPTGPNWDMTNVTPDSWTLGRGYIVPDGTHGDPRISSETRSMATRVSPVILV